MNPGLKLAAGWIAAWSAVAGTNLAQERPTPRPLPFLHAAGTAIAGEDNQPVILSGCNLGNWLLIEPWMLGIFDRAGPHDQSQLENVLANRFGGEAKDRILDLYRENWIGERDFTILKSWGFNIVRVPFHCELLEDEARPGELRPDAFRWLDRAVALARAAGIYIILDLHGAPGGQSLDGVTGQAGRNQFWRPGNRRRGAFLWREIAGHFRDEPAVAAYDLLNEPYGNMNSDNHDADLVGAMDEMIHAIRQVDARHLIFCAGSLRGIEMYSDPRARGWTNVGLTEHFYPGVYGGASSLETHARFIGSNLAARAGLLARWKVPYFAGEYNVVFDRAGGAEMMRRYLDVFRQNGWASTLWSYKLIQREGGVHPDHWYLVTNARPVTPPDFSSAGAGEIEAFCRALGTMDYAQATDLRDALNAKCPPALVLGKYSPVLLPERLGTLPGWSSTDVGGAFPAGGCVRAGDTIQVFGGGRDVYEGSDEFHFVSHAVEGDFRLEAGVTLPADTHVFAKSGLMMRASLAPDAPFVMINLFPDGSCVAAHRDKPGRRFQVENLRLDPGTTALRLARRGASFTAAALGANGTELAARVIDLPDFSGNGEAGLFVLSHDAMQLSEARFSRVDLQTPSKPQKTSSSSP